MDIQEYNETGRISVWREMVRSCRNSGKTVGVWCRENNINVKTYYYRLRRVCATVEVQGTGSSAGAEHLPAFAEIHRPPAVKYEKPAVTVQINGTEIQIHNGADAFVIETVLRVLTRVC